MSQGTGTGSFLSRDSGNGQQYSYAQRSARMITYIVLETQVLLRCSCLQHWMLLMISLSVMALVKCCREQ